MEGSDKRNGRGLLAVLAILTSAAGGLLFDNPAVVAGYAVSVMALAWFIFDAMG